MSDIKVSGSAAPFPPEPIKKEAERESLITLFFSRLFNAVRPEDKNLAGRIAEIKGAFQNAYDALYALREAMQKEDLPHLDRIFLQEVVEPKLREAQRLQNQMLSDSRTGGIKFFEECNEWAGGIKSLLQLYKNKGEMFGEELRTRLEEGVAVSLGKDIQLIQDYLNQSLDKSEADTEKKEVLQRNISAKIAPYIKRLSKLQKEVLTLKLEDLHEWKERADILRAEAFEEALSLIDLAIQEVSPPVRNTAYQEVEKMEQAVVRIFHEMNEPQIDEKKLKRIRKEISVLKRATSEMHGNLSLPHDFFDRLMQIQKDLSDMGRLLD